MLTQSTGCTYRKRDFSLNQSQYATLRHVSIPLLCYFDYRRWYEWTWLLCKHADFGQSYLDMRFV